MIAKDKIQHFIAGLFIALIAGCILDPITGMATVIFAGVGKEIYDYFGGGTPDTMDLVVTILGGYSSHHSHSFTQVINLNRRADNG